LSKRSTLILFLSNIPIDDRRRAARRRRRTRAVSVATAPMTSAGMRAGAKKKARRCRARNALPIDGA
jgi:hypothetical protein